MAVDKLVDSTQLDTDLTSVANAIRAKSGGSSQLAFPSGFVSEIGNIPSGGGTRSEIGSFTVASNYVTSKTISHGLNTSKIFGIVWAEPDENDQIKPNAGYQVLFAHFITYSFPNEFFDGVTLVENYTSSNTKEAVYPEESKNYLQLTKSTWNNTAASWTNQKMVISNIWAVADSDSQITISTNSNSTYFRGTQTWNYKLWSLED